MDYNNQARLPSPKTFFKTLSIIFFALLTGQVLFALVVFSLAKHPHFTLTADNDPLFFISPILTISSAIAGIFVSRQIIAKLAEKETLAQKLAGYQTAIIIRAALSEGPAMLCIVSFMMRENFLFLVIAGLNILYFISFRPSRRKMEEDLNLSYEDKVEMCF
jgi:hypothetical protein